MTDDTPPDSTPDPTEQPHEDPSAEDDLDALLAQASDLADQLSEETGIAEEEDHPVAAESALSGESPDEAVSDAPGDIGFDPPEKLEQQLEQLEERAQTVGDEIGAASDADAVAPDAPPPDSPADASPPAAPEPPSAPADSSDADMPDFMKEFTDADIPSIDDSSEGGSAPAPAKVGVVSSATLGVVSTAATASSSVAGAGDAETQATHETVGQGDSAGRTIGRVLAPLMPIVLAVGGHAAAVLELLDKPFGFLGAGVRTTIGYVAIATTGTSLLVLLTSLFL